MRYILFLSYGGEEQRGRVSKKQSIFFTDLPPPLKRKKTIAPSTHSARKSVGIDCSIKSHKNLLSNFIFK